MIKNLPEMQETRVQSLDWEDPLEKGMATYWRIQQTEEPGRLQSKGSQTVGHDLATNTPAPVFWPGEFHGQRSLAGYNLHLNLNLNFTFYTKINSV